MALPLDDLRRFVTLTRIEDVGGDRRKGGDYFRTFGPEEDATLLVYGSAADPDGALALLQESLGVAGADPQRCADVKLCLLDGDPWALEQLNRRAHAVLTTGDAGWVRMPRPTYGFDQLQGLRAQAERLWGRVGAAGAPYSYEAAISHLVARAWTTEHHVRMGSVPEASLERCVRLLEEHLPSGARLLHVGNFVGVSLSYVLDWARPHGASVVSVDPDLPHRGVEHPQRAVCDLLSHFGLTGDHLLICGYSLEKCFSNDSAVFEGYDPARAWERECAPENVLPSLVASGQRFHAAFMDGNHDPAYLRRELVEIERLLLSGGVLVLDDVDRNWTQIRAVFDELSDGDWPFAPLLADGRIGILRRL